MRELCCLLGVLAFHFCAQAQTFIPYYGKAFYSEIDAGLKDHALKDRLNKLLKLTHKPISYDRAQDFIFTQFYPVRQKGALVVKDVYCQREYAIPQQGKNASAKIVINVEHTWPQSHFSGNYPPSVQKADLHHLYPSDSTLNSDRSNYPFGEVAVDQKQLNCQCSRLGSPKNGKGPVFEPPLAHKGNVARALFYFSVRYQISINETEEMTLRKWNHDDPVDRDEVIRNDEIFKVQVNRNPFVDHPVLVERVKDF